MSLIVFCNIGTRDVILAKKVDGYPFPARLRGAMIRQQLADTALTADQLTFPILQPVLEYIRKNVNAPIDQLVLIGTDQVKEDTKERFWNADTLHYAQLIADVLVPRLNKAMQGEGITAVKQTKVVLIGSKIGDKPWPMQPNVVDEALHTYKELLPQYAAPDTSSCLLVTSGGIPACNTALLLEGVQRFGDRCEVVYKPEDGVPWTLSAGQRIMAMTRIQTAIQFINQFEFGGAFRLLSELPNPSSVTLALLQYAEARLWFDFYSARDHLKKAMKATDARGPWRNTLHPVYESLDCLLDSSEEALIGELYHNALVAWENGRYIDFIGRAVRFAEAVLYYQVGELVENGRVQKYYANLSTKPDMLEPLWNELEKLAAVTNIKKGDPQLIFLRKQLDTLFSISELQTLCADLSIEYEDIPGNTRTDKVRELLDYTLRHGLLNELVSEVRQVRPRAEWDELTNDNPLSVIVPRLIRLTQLQTLREQSIIGHGYGGVSADSILTHYQEYGANIGDSPIQDMEIISHTLNLSLTNPFIQVVDLLQQQISL